MRGLDLIGLELKSSSRIERARFKWSFESIDLDRFRLVPNTPLKRKRNVTHDMYNQTQTYIFWRVWRIQPNIYLLENVNEECQTIIQ